ncbi:hypothetical protein FRC10_000609 [Ceratobasidium sp. 414]|nr:hypothetical protein FRC10_000609 [Ceratobasidium sp. 414]
MTTIFGTGGELLDAEHDTKASTRKQLATEEEKVGRQALHTTVEADLQHFKNWPGQDTLGLLHLRPIEIEEVRELETRLHAQGLKVRYARVCLERTPPPRSAAPTRYDWRSETKTAVFRMPTTLHECPGEWLSNQTDWLTEQLRLVAQCGVPMVTSGGSGGLELKGYGCPCPGKRLELSLDFGRLKDFRRLKDFGRLEDCVRIPFPRVVLEMGYSQKHEELLEKAWNYLFRSDKHIHSVILCDMQYGVSDKEDFWASISVWERKRTGDIDEDWPFEDLGNVSHKSRGEQEREREQGREREREREQGHEREQEQEQEEPAKGLGEDPGRDASPVSSSDTLTTGDTTRVEREEWTPERGGGGKTMVQRWGPTFVVNEREGKAARDESVPFAVPLQVYDFLRICPQHEQEFIPNCELLLPLGRLRREILLTLRLMREHMKPPPQTQPSRKRAASADTSPQPTPGPPTRKPPAGLDVKTKKIRHD